MDILLEVAAPEPTLPGDLCPAGVDLCGESGHSLSLSCTEELEPDRCCCECGAPGTSVGYRSCHCRDTAQDCEGEIERFVLQFKERPWNHHLIKEASQSAAQHILSQSEQTESQIKEQFEKLHQFLRREEEARIATVREEEERKRKKAKEESEKMDKLIQALTDTIKDIETELDEDEISFLQHYEKTIKRTWKDLQHPEKSYDSLIDVPKHVGNLRFRVWEKMKEICPYFPVSVDPNSASCSLAVSGALTSIGCSGTSPAPQHPLLSPADAERFHPYAAALGSEGVTSGLHQWDVEVGDSANWTLGVAYASVKRREEFEACPEAGLWTVGLRDGVYMAMMSPREVLPMDEDRRRPRVVRVRVDCDAGQVCFSDAERDTHLFTFTHTFTRPLYPYFETICKERHLVVRPQRIHVLVEEIQPPDQDQPAETTSEEEEPNS
ncbi:hypothetical protein AALO_G00096140 [Alosa alosa]|uniref:B30.2/SPRY domain-containing protein n=1 Tax=Alosa alosa TaxID=278164 RepID=A0AAV6GTH9_9TELE|nr:E3 ubiquitin-protein ligase TRIM35-like [Alosa alosa]KAG5278185.1 hypothetical protein AALO_G00096140 [Alosa alosa]